MIEAILSIPWYAIGVLTSLAFVLFSWLGLLIIRNTVPFSFLQKNHEVAGYLFGVVGIVYGVVLGFTIPNTQERYNAAHNIIETEANLLIDLYRSAEVFKEPVRKNIQSALFNYVTSVIQDEWPQLSKAQPSASTQGYLHAIWQAYYDLNPEGDREKIWAQESIVTLNHFSSIRLSRINSSHESLGPKFWSLLLLGAFVIICFMYFFAIDSLKAQLLMTALLSSTLGFMIFLLFALDHPFIGYNKLQPAPLEIALNIFKNWSNS